MKRFEGILFCTDIDGTLLNDKKEVSKENSEAIEYFKKEGGLFTFITGRMPFFSVETAKAVRQNAPVGCVNGGGIYDFDKNMYLDTTVLSHDVLDTVEYISKAMPHMGIQVNTFEKVYFCVENKTMENFRAATGLPDLTCKIRDVKEPIAKIIFGHDELDEIYRLRDMLFARPDADRFDYIHSEKVLYEILPKGINKGAALLKIADIMHIDRKRTIAIGDYDNDISMIQAAALGVAVENAKSSVKKVADLITVSNNNHAIAEIIHLLDSGNIKI